MPLSCNPTTRGKKPCLTLDISNKDYFELGAIYNSVRDNETHVAGLGNENILRLIEFWEQEHAALMERAPVQSSKETKSTSLDRSEGENEGGKNQRRDIRETVVENVRELADKNIEN